MNKTCIQSKPHHIVLPFVSTRNVLGCTQCLNRYALCVQELGEAQLSKIPSSLQRPMRWGAKLCAPRGRGEFIQRRFGDGWPRKPFPHRADSEEDSEERANPKSWSPANIPMKSSFHMHRCRLSGSPSHDCE